MKLYLSAILIMFCCSTTSHLIAQSNQDSLLQAKSEKWTVKMHQGMTGMAKPVFGPYTTLDIDKADSAVIRSRSKDAPYFGMELSDKGGDFDISRVKTVTKRKYYILSLADATDTISATFAIASESHEKKETFFGKMISKNNDNQNEVLDYNRNISGILSTNIDTASWHFFIGNFTSGGRQTAAAIMPMASISDGYLMQSNDSIYMQMFSSFSAQIVLIDKNGENLAAISYQKQKPDIWIRNDIDKNRRQAIALLFAVILGIRNM
ncbi:hypothetical protein [Limnovirga soli]|uniref:Uncharacterized protein n=1 Tax=Limnovirga soli TaxID=2656915 RepID=A0A8J8JTN1_9BACT|nr:hypothetical protein [Limnovirga soli]NNV55370.1 hypothetical protein [Limnovirga soli]